MEHIRWQELEREHEQMIQNAGQIGREGLTIYQDLLLNFLISPIDRKVPALMHCSSLNSRLTEKNWVTRIFQLTNTAIVS